MTDPDTFDSEGPVVVPSKRGLARREPAGRERLEEGFARVVELVESIQQHFRLQDERAERMTESLDRITDSLAGVPEASKAQSESLGEIRAQLQAGAAGAKRLEDSLSELPRIADAQRETMVSIGRQFDVLRESGDRGKDSVDELRQSVSRLEEATQASTNVLKDMDAGSTAREEQLAELVREQTRKLTLFALVVIALAAVAALVSVVALFR